MAVLNLYSVVHKQGVAFIWFCR